MEIEDRFRLATEAMQWLVYDYDVVHDVLVRSAGLYHLLGFHPDEAEPTTAWWRARIHPDDLAAIHERTTAAVAARAPATELEYRVRHRDGRMIWVRDHAHVTYGADGRPARIAGYTIDIEERKRLSRHVRFLDELQPILSREGDPDAMLARVVTALADHLDAEVTRAPAAVVAADGPAEILDLLARPSAPWHPDELALVGGVAARVTHAGARARAEQALRRSEERLRLAADAAAVGTFEFDVDTWENTWSATAREIFGLPPDMPPPTDPVEAGLVHPADAARVAGKIRACLDPDGDGGFDDEHRIRRPDGVERWVLVRSQTHFEGDGVARRPRRVLGAMFDITDRREADRRKDEFLAMLGHELRNPLAAIHHATELVKLSHDGDPRLRRATAVLERQTAHMAGLIDGLLEVSRIARGKVALDRRVLDLRGVVDGVLQDRASEIAHRALDVAIDQPGDPVWVDADPIRLAQIIDNLVGNALKFTTAPGRIAVTSARAGARAVVRVRDTGVGIRPEMLARVFEPFQQDAQDLARSSGGLGLGLALARGLVELHRGTIEARSDGPGAGAELIVHLPIVAAPPRPRRAPPRPGTAPRRILVVEDNVDAAEMLQALLQLGGHIVTVVDDGADALARLRGGGADVVLCDLGLPGMSGYELARAVRADPALHDVVLVALTGYGQPEDRRRTDEAGFDAHLVKPIDLESLHGALAFTARPARRATR